MMIGQFRSRLPIFTYDDNYRYHRAFPYRVRENFEYGQSLLEIETTISYIARLSYNLKQTSGEKFILPPIFLISTTPPPPWIKLFVGKKYAPHITHVRHTEFISTLVSVCVWTSVYSITNEFVPRHDVDTQNLVNDASSEKH